MIRAIVVMGVAGSGKSTLGSALAQALGWRFNVAHQLARSRPDGIVISCSALRRSYRNLIRTGDAQVLFVLPMLSREHLQERLRMRGGHFMPATLLDSQLATLELPQPDESAILVPGDASTDEQLRYTLAAARARGLSA